MFASDFTWSACDGLESDAWTVWADDLHLVVQPAEPSVDASEPDPAQVEVCAYVFDATSDEFLHPETGEVLATYSEFEPALDAPRYRGLVAAAQAFSTSFR